MLNFCFKRIIKWNETKKKITEVLHVESVTCTEKNYGYCFDTCKIGRLKIAHLFPLNV